MKRSRSLKNKLIFSYTAVTFAVLLLMGGVFYIFIDRFANQREQATIQTSARQVTTELIQFISREPRLRDLEDFVTAIEAIQGIAIDLVDTEGESLFRKLDPDDTVRIANSQQFLNGVMQLMGRMFNAAGSSGMRRGTMGILPNSTSGTIKVPDFSDSSMIPLDITGTGIRVDGDIVDGFFVVQNAQGVRLAIIRPALIAFLSASAVALFLAVLLGWWMGKRMSKPLNALQMASAAMGSGNLTLRIPDDEIQRTDEIGTLAKQFNSMADALESTVSSLEQEKQTLQNFISDASHELRTPLTALTSYLELAQTKIDTAGTATGSDILSYLQKGQVQVERLGTIVSELLLLSRIENGVRSLQLSDNSLHSVLDEAVSLSAGADLEGEVTVRISIAETVLGTALRTDRNLLVAAIQNLLTNSIKFTRAAEKPVNGTYCPVEITAELQGTKLLLSIRDNGIGIRKEDEERIFDRFYRSPAHTVEGSGLGLSIVRSSLHRLGGRVHISNRSDGVRGVVGTITLPLHSNP